MPAQATQAIFHHGSQERIDWTNGGSAVVAGDIVVLAAGLVGVCTSPEGIAAGALGSLAITGFFKIKKAISGGVTFAVGTVPNWNDTTNTSQVAAGDAALGVTVKAAADADNHVLVDLNANA